MTTPKYGRWNNAPNGMVSTITPFDTRGPKRLWDAGKGYVVRERGDVDGVVVQEYLCPVHGRFEARVSRRGMPEEMACPTYTTAGPADGFRCQNKAAYCGLTSPWSPSTFHAWASSGEVKS